MTSFNFSDSTIKAKIFFKYIEILSFQVEILSLREMLES